ncbi:NAD-dependent DNA ligase [Noviherbaspirillum cavernae]|uniref:NAD-dependent DNA ligase n=1 Tax=Noviherbaspirillum cavernae TaxID=2320862 RepID=A0A418WYQ2_9BURK|nr:BRCT domain-containing protein [Noviherbaspirillum cavernae]RJG05357.1 NAD-dependent DNA ligase [Noviherbaspirillum cavernae]
MHSDHSAYFKFTGKARLEKSINSLLGIVEGISADSRINANELEFLNHWLNEHRELAGRHPFNELMPLIIQAIEDGLLSDEERQDIRWLCERLRSSEYFDRITADIQRLHAIAGAIAADGRVTEAELRGLSNWLAEHDHLKTCWPYDEIDSLVTKVMSDGKIDDEEHRIVQGFFSEFIVLFDNRTIVSPSMTDGISLVGLCAVCPEISFAKSIFCFTGTSSKYTRTELAGLVNRLGGEVANGVGAKLNYLVIGADGNPCWTYACYGRKVEKAVELRKQGKKIVIVHENDFHDALADS